MAFRKILAVVGCHRSGTSALAGLLSRLGWDAPKNQIGKSRWNQKGYFESPDIRDFHDGILEEIERPVFDLRPTPKEIDFKSLAETHFDQIGNLLHTQFGTSEHVLVKDPRIARLLPLWVEYAAETGDDLRVVLSLRQPIEVAQSLNARNGFSIEQGHLIWLRENIMALRYARGLPISRVLYQDVLKDWQSTISTAFSELELGIPSLDQDTQTDISSFLSPDLRHQVANQNHHLSENWILRLAEVFYRTLQAKNASLTTDLISAFYELAIARLEAPTGSRAYEAYSTAETSQSNMQTLEPFVSSISQFFQSADKLLQALERVLALEEAHQNSLVEIGALGSALIEQQEATRLREIELQETQLEMKGRAAEVALLLKRFNSEQL